jgi:hypothetical protein
MIVFKRRTRLEANSPIPICLFVVTSLLPLYDFAQPSMDFPENLRLAQKVGFAFSDSNFKDSRRCNSNTLHEKDKCFARNLLLVFKLPFHRNRCHELSYRNRFLYRHAIDISEIGLLLLHFCTDTDWQKFNVKPHAS